MLPVSAIFTGRVLSYKSVYAHFRKWSRNGEWKKFWGKILSRHRSFLDMSSVDLDGSHTTTLRGGECCGYQGRKKRTTTNAIYVADRQGIPLAIPRLFRVLTTTFTASPRYFRTCSQVLRTRACPYWGSFSMQTPVLTLHNSGGIAISRRCSQTWRSIIAGECEEMTSGSMKCFTRRGTALKGPMRGWIHIGAYSTGSTPHKPVGRDGTISHLY